ncbi:MAG: serine protease [Candidatus Omnitrophota bacterium]|nr:serine protease [Candidatus Omnitrophota bacterium]
MVQAETVLLTDEAENIFKAHKAHVFQIRVIDLSSGKKSTTGSGFVFSSEGHVATNYHVVSDAVHKPGQYRIEYLDDGGQSGPLELLDVDVIHDLAVLKGHFPQATHIALGESSFSKGAKIFSMGNPYDLGMTIIEGTYNGLMEKSLYPKILFSGSLNPGMSGGPALDHSSKIIGINVSTGGNALSFLVPVEYLKKLYGHAKSRQVPPLSRKNVYIEEQLLAHQDEYLPQLLAAPWNTVPFGETVVPAEISNIFKCWGKTEDEEHMLYTKSSLYCAMDDYIFVSSDLWSGRVLFAQHWVKSKKLDPLRFYNLNESFFAIDDFDNAATKEEVTNFACHTDFVDIAGKNWKIAFCARQYKKYPRLYDVGLFMASLAEDDRALLVELNALGLSREKALQFVSKFIGEVKWQK